MWGKKSKSEKKTDQVEPVIHETTSDKSLIEQYEEMKKKHPDSFLLSVSVTSTSF